MLLACVILPIFTVLIRPAYAHVHLAGIVGQGSLSSVSGAGLDSLVAHDCRDCTNSTFDASHSLAVDDYSTSKVTCNGKTKGTSNITLNAGTLIGLDWRLDITHPGPAALYISFDNDETWFLLAQAIDIFIGESPGEADIFDPANKGNFLNVVWDITLPKNLPSSQTATLRGEFFNTQAPEAYVSCIDVITNGPGTIPSSGGFDITGTVKGFSHLPGLGTGNSAITPYAAYDTGTNFVTNNIGYNNFIANIWRGPLGGPPIADFGNSDYTQNVNVTHLGANFPGSLTIDQMNPSSSTKSSSSSGGIVSSSVSSSSITGGAQTASTAVVTNDASNTISASRIVSGSASIMPTSSSQVKTGTGKSSCKKKRLTM